MYKKLFSLFMIALLPICANADCPPTYDSNNEVDGCVSYDGCYFIPADAFTSAECAPCGRDNYNNSFTATDDYHQKNCTPCPPSYQPDSHKQPDIFARVSGQSECPWTCEDGYSRNGDTCQPCHANAVYNNSQCECKAGYYGNGTDTCEVCEYGKTSAQGARNESYCHMTRDTLFCDADGQNCMKLIP